MKFLRFLGLLLIVGGLALLALIYGPVLKQEYQYQTSLKGADIAASKETAASQTNEFRLVIPKIGVNAQVFPGVDANNPNEYLPILKKGVAQAKGSALPNEEGAVFIFAHSADSPLDITQYNAVFYLLPKLEVNDEIFLNYLGESYEYQVTGQHIFSPAELVEFLTQPPEADLLLQTCHPPGTTINRLLIMAKHS